MAGLCAALTQSLSMFSRMMIFLQSREKDVFFFCSFNVLCRCDSYLERLVIVFSFSYIIYHVHVRMECSECSTQMRWSAVFLICQ